MPMGAPSPQTNNAEATATASALTDGVTLKVAREVLTEPAAKQRSWRRTLPFLGPAFVACVAYIDPGNFATNLQSGAQLGYTLVWVVVASNLMGMLIQALSAKLGIATGRNLAEHCRERLPKPLVWALWGLMELVAMATDLAEFLGAALGMYLLFGLPLWIAGLATAVITFLILLLERYGFRPLEALITGIVGAIALCYAIELFLAKPDWKQVAWHSVVPGFGGADGLFLACGILGATVMPHVIFLHSSLTQGRIVVTDPLQQKRLYRYEILDVVIAMGVAGMINAAMLIMAAKMFHENGLVDVDAIEKAYLTLEPLLGSAASTVFGISLLAAGLSSSAVGTMSGQVIMQGFLNYHIPVWIRRIVTMLPALTVIFLGLDPTRTLVFSQVLLSFGLPFALLPLLLLTSRKSVMGVLTNHKITTVIAGAITLLIIALNLFLLIQTFSGR